MYKQNMFCITIRLAMFYWQNLHEFQAFACGRYIIFKNFNEIVIFVEHAIYETIHSIIFSMQNIHDLCYSDSSFYLWEPVEQSTLRHGHSNLDTYFREITCILLKMLPSPILGHVFMLDTCSQVLVTDPRSPTETRSP